MALYLMTETPLINGIAALLQFAIVAARQNHKKQVRCIITTVHV